MHTEPDDAQHQQREHGDIQQCVDHGSTNAHCPSPLLLDRSRARKIPGMGQQTFFVSALTLFR